MEIRKTPNKRFVRNLMIMILSGIIMLTGSVFIFNHILIEVFGPYAFSDNMLSLENFTMLLSRSEVKAGIVYSKNSEKLLPEGNTWLLDNISIWQTYLKGHKIKPEIIFDEDVEQGRMENYDVVIFPGSKALSDREVIEIKKYVDGGGSLLVTGSLGIYSADGEWRGWELFTEVFGTRYINKQWGTNQTMIMTLRGSTPVSANIPAGYTLKVRSLDVPLALKVMEPRSNQVSFWYDYRTQGGLVGEEIQNSAGLIYGTYGKGKFVWMGFDVISLVGDGYDYVIFDRMIKNSIDWLSGQPVAYVSPWPDSRNAAAVITAVVDEEPGSIFNLLPILEHHNIRGAFFVEPSIAESNPQLIKTLSGYGDVCVIADIGYAKGSDDTTGFINDRKTQAGILEYSKRRIESITGKPVAIFEPYYGQFDDNTLNAMADTDIEVLVTDSLTDRSVPKYVIKGEEELTVVSRTVRDDYKIIKDYGLTNPDYQLYTYMEDIDRALFESSVYLFQVHTGYQCSPEYIEVVSDVIEYIKEKNIWITDLNELHTWWSEKSKVELRVEQRGTRRLVIAASNVGETDIRDLTIPVEFQQQIRQFNIDSEIIGTKAPEWMYDEDRFKLDLNIDLLSPGDSRVYYIDYDFPAK